MGGFTGGGHHDEDGLDDRVVDYKGHAPVDKSKTGGWLGAGLALGTELSERICVMGIAMNLVTYLTAGLHLPASKSANIVTNFMGTLNLMGLVGGFLADAAFGRYTTVAIFSSITALGVSLLTLATIIPGMRPPPCDYRSHEDDCVEATGSQLAMLYAALYTIALGAGGIKSNVSGFGTDQFDPTDAKEEKTMVFFFNRFYFSISMGSLFAVTVLVYIQDNVGRGIGYGISAGTMVVAVIVLLCGTKYYRYRKPKGSPLTVIWRVLFLAWTKRNMTLPSDPALLNDTHQTARVPHTDKFRCLDKAAIVDEFAAKEENRSNPWIISTVTQVEEVKMVLRLIPIWSTCILFWTVYSQMTTFTVEQAAHMNAHIGSFLVPSGSFSVFLFISILTFTSLNERFIVPLAAKITHNPRGLTSLQRIAIGLLSAIAAMAAAALVDKYRRDRVVHDGVVISAFWLVPQLFLVGAGEAFAYVGQLEFFIREAPERMKSMSTGFFLTTLAMGFFFSSVLVTVVDSLSGDSWLKTDMNKGKLDYFYWLLALLGVLNFLVFLAFARRHQYKIQPDTITAAAANNNGCNDEKELQLWNDV